MSEPKHDLVASLLEALTWCGGSPDFNEGGQAHEGWLRICEPAIQQAKKTQVHVQTFEAAIRELRQAVGDVVIPGRTVKPQAVDDAITRLLLLVDVTEDEERAFRSRHDLPAVGEIE